MSKYFRNFAQIFLEKGIFNPCFSILRYINSFGTIFAELNETLNFK